MAAPLAVRVAVGAMLSAMCALPAFAGPTADSVRSRGYLRCGVSDGVAGFSAKRADGRWTGLGVDYCRALAAAVLGDPDKVRYRPLRSSERFPALSANAIDVLARIAVWTMSREVLVNVRFPGVLLYDEQGIMVPANSGVRSVKGLRGATICVVKGTAHQERLADYFADRGIPIKTLVVDSSVEVVDVFLSGKCRAWTSDVAQLAVARSRAPRGLATLAILPERLSMEPLALAVRPGDEAWFMTVRWVLYSLIAAEEMGVTQANAAQRISESRSPTMRRLVRYEQQYAAALGLRPDWILRSVQAAGNYGEIFERNLGRGSTLGMGRGANRLWKHGGLMYAPPLH